MSRWQRLYKTQKGIIVRSKYERDVLNRLDELGVVYAYEALDLEWSEKIRARCGVCTSTTVYKDRKYKPDLRLRLNSFVELKGKFNAMDRKILLGVRERYPVCVFRILFMRDNWMTKKKAQRYTDWAAKNGFESAVGIELPRHWHD